MAATTDASELYWLPWLHVYQDLQEAAHDACALPRLEAQLKATQRWLLGGSGRFRPPSPASAAALQAGGALRATAYGPGKGIAVDKTLVAATLELAQILSLDELQCHLLLKRHLKLTGTQLVPPPPPAGGSTQQQQQQQQAQVVLPAAVVQAVVDYYGQERVYLAKCQQLVIMTALDLGAEASVACRRVLQQLLQQDWGSQVLSRLKALLSPQGDGGAATAAASAAAAGAALAVVAPVAEGGSCTHVLKPPSVEHQLFLHALNERCEVLCLLTQLYAGASAATCPGVWALEARQREQAAAADEAAAAAMDADGADGGGAAGADRGSTSSLLQDSRAAAAEAAETAALLAELQSGGLAWPSCGAERFTELLQLLGSSVYSASAGIVAAAHSAGGGGDGDSSGAHSAQAALPGAAGRAWLQATANGSAAGGGRSQAAVLQQLSEALASSLVLAALRPGQLLQDMADAAAKGSHQLAHPCTLHWRSIGPSVEEWRPVPGNAMVMLALHAYNQLLVVFNPAGGVESMQGSLQERAMRAGGFAACGAALGLEELAGGTLAGQLHRGLTMQGLSLLAAAFSLSPAELPPATLGPLVQLLCDTAQGCPHLAEQAWDASVASMLPLRCFLEDAARLFPAFLDPFLRLAAGFTQGSAAAQCCYKFICHEVSGMAVVLPGPDVPGITVMPNGREVAVTADMPWPRAPDVIGTMIPAGINGSLRRLPAFARPPAASADDADMDDMPGPAGDGSAGDPAVAAVGPWPLLAVLEVQADQGMGPVLLLARAAECLNRLQAMADARQAVAGSQEWQDLRLILRLLAALLRHEPLLVSRLLAVSIVYNNNQSLDWVDIILAALNVLPALALHTAASLGGSAAPGGAAPLPADGAGAGGARAFCWAVLHSLADCLAAAGVAAGSQPGRVLGALCSCRLLEGAAAAREPLPMVPLEGLASWVHAQHQQQQQQHQQQHDHGRGAEGSVHLWAQLSCVQALQDALEVPAGVYPLTSAVVRLTSSLLALQTMWGPVPSLLGFALQRVLGAMPWLPFSDPVSRWQLAASALAAVRLAVVSGALGLAGAAGPKALGPPAGLAVTALSAKVIHHLATAGHGYLSAVLPPPAHILQDMADQVTGSSQLLAAGQDLALELLLLVPPLLGACAHLSPELPLQQYWAAEPPGGGLRPAGVIASYITCALSAQLQAQAWTAVNAFALLQAPALHSSGRAPGGAPSGAQAPSAGGPAVPLGVPGITGLGALAGPVHGGMAALAHSHHHGGAHGHQSRVLTMLDGGGSARGGAGVATSGGWWRPSGLFAALLAALPSLKPSLVAPLRAAEAAAYPDTAVKALQLLEAGARSFAEVLDAMCFPTSLAADEQQTQAAAAATLGGKAAAQQPFSALDGLLQLLRQAPQLLKSQPRLLAGVLRALRVLWECQAGNHGAVELLRSQPAFWQALHACLPPNPGRLPAFDPEADLAEGAAAAWQLQAHASALHIVLLETVGQAPPPPPPSPRAAAGVGGGGEAARASAGAEAGADDGPPAAEAARQALLGALGPQDLSRLLLACAGGGQQPQLLAQLSALLQVTYLELGATAVTGAWGPPALKSDVLRCAAQFRAEAQPLLDAVAAGQFSRADLQQAATLLVARYAPLASAAGADGAAADGAAGGDADEDGMFEAGPAGRSASCTPWPAGGAASSGGSSRARELMGALLQRPLGSALLGHAAAGVSAWSAPETEYGSAYLYDALRLELILGPEVLQRSEAAAALVTTLAEVNTAASVAHAHLALLQAAVSLLHAQARLQQQPPKAQQWAAGKQQQQLQAQAMRLDVAQGLVETCCRAVGASLRTATELASTEAAPLVLSPWGLTFAAHTSSAELLLCCRALMLAVCGWKAAAARAAMASDVRAAGGRPVLMARHLNQHSDSFKRTVARLQAAAAASSSGGKAQERRGSEGAGAGADASAQGGSSGAGLVVCGAQCAQLLSRWLRGSGGDSLRKASNLLAVGAGGAIGGSSAAAATFEQHIEVVESLSTVLLMLLQALPTQQARAARMATSAAAAAAAAAAGGSDSLLARSSSLSPASRAAAVAAAARAAADGAASAAVEGVTPGDLSALEEGLLDLLPALCDACAIAVSQQPNGGAGGAGDDATMSIAGGSDTAASSSAAAAADADATRSAQAREAYAAPLVQLLIEVLSHHLPPELWLAPVSQHLALLPMLAAVASRAGGPARSQLTAPPAAGARGGAAAGAGAKSGGGGGGGGVPAAVSVTDISVLELLRAVAQAPDGAMQLWQQGVLPVLVGFCRQLLHARDQFSGLLDAAALGYVGPNAAAVAAAQLQAPAVPRVSRATLGAYTAAAAGAGAAGVGGGSAGAASAGGAGSGGGFDAAAGGVVWSGRHQQWCLVLELWSVLLTRLSRSVSVTDVALELLVAAEPRMLLALRLQDAAAAGSSGAGAAAAAAGAGSGLAAGALSIISGLAGGSQGGAAPQGAAASSAAVRVSLANALEAGRCLLLLQFLTAHVGEWQVVRPGSLAAFRAAAAALVEFAALPHTDRSLRVSCAPLSPFERKLSCLPSGLEPPLEGWFRLCAAGGANSRHLGSLAAAAAAAAAAGGAGGQALGLVPAVNGGGSDGGDAAGGSNGCSEYCARLGEAVYTAAEHALQFLVATAPAVDPAEVAAAGAGGLGPMWPSVRALTALQDQALAVGEAMTRDAGGAISGRKSRVALCCCRIMAGAGALLEALNPSGVWGGGAGGAGGWQRGGGGGVAGGSTDASDGSGAETARKLERMNTIQRAASLSFTT